MMDCKIIIKNIVLNASTKQSPDSVYTEFSGKISINFIGSGSQP